MTIETTTKRLSGWGRYPSASCESFELDSLLQSIEPFHEYSSVTPRGLGRSYGDASLGPPKGIVLETHRLDEILSFDSQKGVITAQAGVSLKQILDLVIPKGWFLSVSPGTKFITLGGALASNIHGKNHHLRGSISNFVLELHVLTEDGVHRCTPNETTDLFYATIGGYGLTGIILQATLQLKPIETAIISARLIKARNFEQALRISDELEDKYEYAVTWIDLLARGRQLGRGIVMLGEHTTLDELPTRNPQQSLRPRWEKAVSAACPYLHLLMNRFSNLAFNWLYFHKQFQHEVYTRTGFDPWFYPLDRLRHWNHLYGKSGFVQYQFVVPKANGIKAIQETLELITQKQIGSFLSVLKSTRADTVALPFAVPGYTLGMDFSLKDPEVLGMLNRLDRIVVKHGGRVYLTKDARLSPEAFRDMQPEFDHWIESVRKYAPSGRFQTRLSQRLKF